MAVYITGDLHRNFGRIADFCERMNTSKREDWIICLGDVGLNYYGGELDETVKRDVSDLPIKLFCIRGNHEMRSENIPGYRKWEIDDGVVKGAFWYDPEYPNQYFAIDGELYGISNKMALVCGGAYSVDKFYRLEHGWRWFDDEQPNDFEKNVMKSFAVGLRVNNTAIDLVLTHTCPTRFIPTELFLPGIDQSKVDRSTEDSFDEVYDLLPDPKPHWYFGHYHGNKYADEHTMLFEEIIELK